MDEGPERRAAFANAWTLRARGREDVITCRAKNDK